MFNKIKSLLPFILLPIGVGRLSSIFTSNGMEMFATYDKAPLSPPGWLFAPVCTILYTLMGISSWIIYNSNSENKEKALSIYIYQLVVNFLWPVFFFSFQLYFFSLLWLILLWILVAIMIVRFYRITPQAGILNIPYLIWLTFAAYLNTAVWLM